MSQPVFVFCQKNPNGLLVTDSCSDVRFTSARPLCLGRGKSSLFVEELTSMSKRWAAYKSRGWWECQPIKSGGEWDESGATGQAAACYCPLRYVLIPRSFPSVREPEDSGATLGCGVWVSPGWPWGPRGWGLVAKGTFFVPEAQYLCNVVVEDSVVFKCWPGYLSLLLGPSNMNDFEVSPSLVNSIFHYWDHFKLKLYNLLIQVRAKLQ